MPSLMATSALAHALRSDQNHMITLFGILSMLYGEIWGSLLPGLHMLDSLLRPPSR